MNYIGKIFEQGDWLGKAIFEIETDKGKVIGFLRYSSHHKMWSVEQLYERRIKELNLEEVDWFPEELPIANKITFCDWID